MSWTSCWYFLTDFHPFYFRLFFFLMDHFHCLFVESMSATISFVHDLSSKVRLVLKVDRGGAKIFFVESRCWDCRFVDSMAQFVISSQEGGFSCNAFFIRRGRTSWGVFCTCAACFIWNASNAGGKFPQNDSSDTGTPQLIFLLHSDPLYKTGRFFFLFLIAIAINFFEGLFFVPWILGRKRKQGVKIFFR